MRAVRNTRAIYLGATFLFQKRHWVVIPFIADLENTTEFVGAWLASERALRIAKSFAGKPCSYRMWVVLWIGGGLAS